MKISLTPETGQRIRDVLGDDVDLAPDVIPEVLARLAVEAPATYSQVLAEISGSQIRLDSEDELHRRRRRSVLRRLFFSWGEYETAVGDRLLAKRHIAAAVPLSIAALTLGILVLSIVFGHRTGPSPVHHAAAFAAPGGSIPRGRIVPRLVTPPPPPSRSAVSVAVPEPTGPGSRTSLANALPVPPLPEPVDTQGSTVRPPGSPIVVSSPASRAPDPAVQGSPNGALPVVYNRAPDVAVEHAAPVPPDAVSSSVDERNAAIASKRGLVPGARIPARLVTGILAVPGGPPMPVAVATTDPAEIWLGQAVLGPGDRVQVMVSLSGKGRGELVRGLVLDPERLVPGISGRTTIQRPAAVTSMAVATLQAAADYIQAIARQESINVFDGWVQVSGGAAPAWTYAAARLAQELDTRGLSRTWVPTTEVPAGIQLVILVTEAS